jgi:hypothetical protein
MYPPGDRLKAKQMDDHFENLRKTFAAMGRKASQTSASSSLLLGFSCTIVFEEYSHARLII